jgi:hypothetical protein
MTRWRARAGRRESDPRARGLGGPPQPVDRGALNHSMPKTPWTNADELRAVLKASGHPFFDLTVPQGVPHGAFKGQASSTESRKPASREALRECARLDSNQ